MAWTDYTIKAQGAEYGLEVTFYPEVAKEVIEVGVSFKSDHHDTDYIGADLNREQAKALRELLTQFIEQPELLN